MKNLNHWQKFYEWEEKYNKKVFSTPKERMNAYISLYDLVFSLKSPSLKVFKNHVHVKYFTELKRKLGYFNV